MIPIRVGVDQDITPTLWVLGLKIIQYSIFNVQLVLGHWDRSGCTTQSFRRLPRGKLRVPNTGSSVKQCAPNCWRNDWCSWPRWLFLTSQPTFVDESWRRWGIQFWIYSTHKTFSNADQIMKDNDGAIALYEMWVLLPLHTVAAMTICLVSKKLLSVWFIYFPFNK